MDIYLILTIILSYFIGSFPTGYLLVKQKHNKDLTKEGSGNVGTLNAFKVSQSKKIGLIVLLIDFLKGAVPVFLLTYVFNKDFYYIFASSVSLIIGHNYPVWLKFKGGRGLATAAGIFAVINYLILLTWGLIWLISFAVKKGVLISNFVATLIFPFFTLAFSSFYSSVAFSVSLRNDYSFLVVFAFIISFLLLLKHSEIIFE
ncbi:MAG: glycerol-3-phosphate acyltransferase [Ignavibacteria bacterium]